MNKTNLQHAGYALIIQVITVLVTGNWWTGCAAGTFFFIGREHAQAEKRITADVKTLNWYDGFLNLNKDSIMDILIPAICCATIAILMDQWPV